MRVTLIQKTMMLEGKNVLLGVTGSIAAYKSTYLVSYTIININHNQKKLLL